MNQIVRLTESYREKVWGVLNLEPWFRSAPDKIGEVWFLNPEPDPLPILVKFIFTSELLSVQVHPDDEFAWSRGDVSGKTEMWYILRAEPAARLAMGFREPVSRERMRAAALSGEIETMLEWFEVRPGQVYFIPPGTVHALGPGIVLCEIQQHADITYRLYDYGRPRELHLEKAVAASNLGRHGGPTSSEANPLASCNYFVAERISLDTGAQVEIQPRKCDLLIALEGAVVAGGDSITPGQVWLVREKGGPVGLTAVETSLLLRSHLPDLDASH